MSLIKKHKEKWEDIILFNIERFNQNYMIKNFENHSGLTRYFYSFYSPGVPTIKDLVVVIGEELYYELYYSENKIQVSEIIEASEKIREEFMRYLIKQGTIYYKHEFEYKATSKIRNQLSKILASETVLKKEYFMTYNHQGDNKFPVKIEDDSGSISVIINLNNDKLETELGFYKTKYLFVSLAHGEKNIRSAIQIKGTNKEVGFLDNRAYGITSDMRYKTIYSK